MEQEEMSVKEAARTKGVSLKRVYDLLAEGRRTASRTRIVGLPWARW